jgi:hypothetical protein
MPDPPQCMHIITSCKQGFAVSPCFFTSSHLLDLWTSLPSCISNLSYFLTTPSWYDSPSVSPLMMLLPFLVLEFTIPFSKIYYYFRLTYELPIKLHTGDNLLHYFPGSSPAWSYYIGLELTYHRRRIFDATHIFTSSHDKLTFEQMFHVHWHTEVTVGKIRRE